MKFAGKEIKSLTDNELQTAILSVVDIDKNRLDQIEKSRKRHIKLFETYPPTENPIFTQLAEELNIEFKNRGLTDLINKEI